MLKEKINSLINKAKDTLVWLRIQIFVIPDERTTTPARLLFEFLLILVILAITIGVIYLIYLYLISIGFTFGRRR